jgi:antitoxin component YwqK of YwqJK toxin-antitoxin module
VELIDLVPNSLSFRVISTIDIESEAEIPTTFTGRVRYHENGKVAYVAWYKDGQLNNPGRNHPAYRRFRSNGKLKFEMYYTHGLLHDPGATTPAVRGYFADGSLHYEERYWAGRRNDAKNGTAAIRKWRRDGRHPQVAP